MNLLPLPAFSDNYIWLLHNGKQALVVDPGDAAPVQAALQALQLQLQAILVTHHHADHVGGVDALRDATGALVYGPAFEVLPEPVVRVDAATQLHLWACRGVCWKFPGIPLGILRGIASLPIKRRFCSVATPCFLVAVVACLKALPSKCMHRYSNWPSCRRTPVWLVRMNTL